jgi:hypothetical protein
MKWLIPVSAVVVIAVAFAGLAAWATLNDRVEKLEEARQPRLHLLALR